MKQIFMILVLFFSVSNSQIAYPQESSLDSSQNVNERQPIFIPGLCPTNQWYWPGDQETDWVCDCATRFVYHPKTDMCHELYRKGPCEKNEYLVLEKGKIIPECVQNPCLNDTMVPFNDNCFRLYKDDACPKVSKLERILNVNHTTLRLECMLESTVELNGLSVHVVRVPCLPGSKRSASGQCRVIVG